VTPPPRTKIPAGQIARAFSAQRSAFRAFLVARVGPAEADDILQDGLLKALRHAGDIADDERTVAWFYRVLRNAVADHYRARAADRRRDDVLARTLAAGGDTSTVPPAWERRLCACLETVIDSLKPRERELLRRIELAGESVQETARRLGLSANQASVALHRARRKLRARLAAFCGACATGACLDCDCTPPKSFV